MLSYRHAKTSGLDLTFRKRKYTKPLPSIFKSSSLPNIWRSLVECRSPDFTDFTEASSVHDTTGMSKHTLKSHTVSRLTNTNITNKLAVSGSNSTDKYFDDLSANMLAIKSGKCKCESKTGPRFQLFVRAYLDELLCWSFVLCVICAQLKFIPIYASTECWQWQVRSWMVNVSSSSCKSTSGLLHSMGSNTVILLF